MLLCRLYYFLFCKEYSHLFPSISLRDYFGPEITSVSLSSKLFQIAIEALLN